MQNINLLEKLLVVHHSLIHSHLLEDV